MVLRVIGVSMEKCSFCSNFLWENGLCPECYQIRVTTQVTQTEIASSGEGLPKKEEAKIKKAAREGFEAFQVGVS